MSDRNLELSTLFKAELHSSFTAVTRRLKGLLTEMNKAMAQAGKTTGKTASAISKDFRTLYQDHGEYALAMGRSTNQTKKFQQALTHFGQGKQGAALKTVESDLMRVEKAVQATAMRMDNAGRVGRKFREEGNRIGLMNRVLEGRLKATSTGFEKITGKMRSVTQASAPMNKQLAQMSGGWNRVFGAMKVTASYGLAATFISSMVGSLKVGTTEIVAYDQALKNLQAITRATDAEILVMGDTLRDVARTTKYSTTEVAEGMVLLGQAGFSATESMAAIQATANLAAGTLTNLATTADLLTTTIRAFNLEAGEAGRVSDVMANAVNKSKLTIDKLRTSFNYVGATASQAGLSLEEVAATMMTLANNGLRASTIGTGMRQVISRMIAPNRKLRDAFTDAGISLDKVNPKIVGYQKAVGNLSDVLWDSSKNSVNMAKAFELFGLRGAQAAAVLVKGYKTGGFKDALESVNEVGSAAMMAGIQSEGLGFQFKNLADRAKELAVAFGDAGVTGGMKGFVAILRTMLEVTRSVVTSGFGSFIVQAGLLTTVIVGATVAVTSFWAAVALSQPILTFKAALLIAGSTITAFTTGTMSATAALGGFKAALGLIGGPVFWIAAGIAVLVAGLNRVVSSSKRAAESSAKLAAETKLASEALDSFNNNLEDLPDDADGYRRAVERLAQEHPDLAREMREVLGVADLTTVAYKDLKKASEDLANVKHSRAIESSSIAVKDAAIHLERARRGQASWTGFLGAFSGKLDAYTIPIKKATVSFHELADAHLKLVAAEVKSGRITRKEAIASLYTLNLAGKERKKLVSSLIKTIDNQAKVEDDFRRLEIEALKATEKRVFEGVNARLGAYEDYYNTLDDLEKAHFRETMISAERAATNKKKALKEQEVETSVVAAAIQEIWNKAHLQRIEDEGGTQEEIIKKQKEWLALAKKAAKQEADEKIAEIKRERDEAIKAKEESLLDSNLSDIGKQGEINKVGFDYSGRINAAKEISEEELKGRIRAIDSAEIYEKKSTKRKKLDQEKDVKRAIELAREKADGIIAISEMAVELETSTKLNSLEVQLEAEKEYIATVLQERQKLVDEAKSKYDVGSEEYKNALQKKIQAEADYNQTVLQLRTEIAREINRIDEEAFNTYFEKIEKKRRLNQITSEEYIAALQRAKELEIIDDDEFYERKTIAAGTWIERFKLGLEQAEQGVDGWGETVVRIGAEFKDTFVNNMTDSIMSFIDGTKSAQEAFADFGRSTLRWLAQMIIKQMLLNSLKGFGLFGGAAGAAIPVGHTGGIIGKDPLPKRVVNPNVFSGAPRYHSGGIVGSEQPIIAKKGEGIFTPEQMNAIGGLIGKKNQDIINVVDPHMMDSYMASPKGKNAILNIIGSNSASVRGLLS